LIIYDNSTINYRTLEPAISLAEKSFPLDFSIDPNRIRGSIEIAIFPDKYPNRFGGVLIPEGIQYWGCN